MSGNTEVTVLIADDDPNTEYLLEIFCRDQEDIRLVFVPNGQAALDRIAQGEIDVVVTDIRMPLMSGDELLSVLRTRPRSHG